ncbi:MAG: M20 family metallopeptidase [Thermoplasmatota archaeon]
MKDPGTEGQTLEPLEMARKLIETPSTSSSGTEIYDLVFELLKERCPGTVWMGSKSRYLEYSDFRNVYAKVGSGKGPKIMLNCHLDTVDPGNGWTESPFSAIEKNGRIYGLGAADMKGGSACAIASFLDMASRDGNLNGELYISCVFGEEAPYSLGTDTLLSELDMSDFDLVIIPEPSPLLGIYDHCVVHKRIHGSRFPVVIVGAEGRVLFEVEFFGKASHASHPSQGINALHDASRFITELTRFDLFSSIKMGRGHYVVLNVDGGDHSFTVPSYCKLLVNRQLTLGEDEKKALREVQDIARSLKLRSKVKIKKRYSPSPELEYRPYLYESSRYLDMFLEHVPVPPYGRSRKKCLFTTSSVGDFNLFGTRTNVPTVIYGPGGGNIHSPNEFVNCSEIIQVKDHLTGFLMEAFDIGKISENTHRP